MKRFAFILAACGALGACQRTENKKKTDTATAVDKAEQGSADSMAGGAKAHSNGVEQQVPPFDLKTPPADATKTASGMIYKKIAANDAGQAIGRNDTVLMNYDAWVQSTGETFFTTKTRGQAMPLNLSNAAPGFVEGLQLLKKGEKAMMWIPPELGYKSPPKQGKPETLVYSVEVVDIIPAPTVPADVAAPPANALTLKSGTKYVVVRPGTGAEKPRSFDTVTYNFTAWDSNGHMFDSTEVRKRPASVPPFRQSAVMEEVLTSMTAGERVRFWTDASKLSGGAPNGPTGTVCYELEVLQIQKAVAAPPPTPSNVASPPANAKKTPKGVSYVILKTGKGGPKPTASDTVKVDYTGWTTDGRMFDSSIVRGEPAEFSLGGVIAGWTDGVPVLSVGDTARFWIPEELAYKGNPGRPQGMLVFDITLLDIKAPNVQAPASGDLPPPADVAAAPADAKKSPAGVPYKVIKAGPAGGKHPTADDTVKVNYTGWTTDGKMFDSSRGNPIEFPLKGVIKGWTDAIPMMAIGDTTRFWIPEALAYQGQAGAPAGTLVFDVELIDIKSSK